MAREQVVESLGGAIERIPRRSGGAAKPIAETIFAVYLATMFEWLMREGVEPQWLIETMRMRLELLVEGVA